MSLLDRQGARHRRLYRRCIERRAHDIDRLRVDDIERQRLGGNYRRRERQRERHDRDHHGCKFRRPANRASADRRTSVHADPNRGAAARADAGTNTDANSHANAGPDTDASANSHADTGSDSESDADADSNAASAANTRAAADRVAVACIRRHLRHVRKVPEPSTHGQQHHRRDE